MRKMEEAIRKRRTFGEHLTPIEVFREFILPEMKNVLHEHIWVDLFAGEGNLILPILEEIPPNERIGFFKKHIFLFDVQKELVERAICKAVEYGIPREIAEQNIMQKDTIKNYPKFLISLGLPVYHITNPPYLYIGYIVKHKETQKYLEYFTGENEGYQDLYQLALINDLRHGIRKMIYIIPSNFLFGYSVSNKIRDDLFKFYTIKKAIIFERQIFEWTGTNVVICFFERKNIPKTEAIIFEGFKINKEISRKTFCLKPKNHYRAGNEFEEFVNNYPALKPINVKFYLTMGEVIENQGDFAVKVIDTNAFDGKEYKKREIYVNDQLYNKILSNTLFIRTLDTGSMEGRAGLYLIRDVFGVDGVLVSKAKYRTHPIHVFLEPTLSIDDQILLRDYFNLILEYFREKTDSEFMTTYKYSDSEYTRKYFGLSQAKKLIQTFPILNLQDEEKETLKRLIKNRRIEEIISFIKGKNGKKGLERWC